MSKSREHYTVLQVLFVPDITTEQPTKLIKMKEGDTVQTVLTTFKPGSVYAWRTFTKEVHPTSGLLGMLLASEDAYGHTPWTFLLGTLRTLEQMRTLHHVPQSTIDYHQKRGRTQAVVVKNDFVEYIKDDVDVSALTNS